MHTKKTELSAVSFFAALVTPVFTQAFAEQANALVSGTAGRS